MAKPITPEEMTTYVETTWNKCQEEAWQTEAAKIKTWQQRCEEHPDHEGIVSESMIRARMQEEIDELRQALAQPDHFRDATKKVEPVAWMHTSATGHVYFRKKPHDRVFNPRPVYTWLPQKTWVGLTDDDIWEVFKQYDSMQYVAFSKAIEAKLREKNS